MQTEEQTAGLKITFNIGEIQTVKFAIDNSMKQDSFSKSRLQFQIGAGVRFEPAKRNVVIDTIVDIFCDQDKARRICESVTRVVFYIENFDELFKVEGQQLKASDLVMKNLVSMSVSTTRGMLAAKTEGSILSGVYLPPVDVTNFKTLPPQGASAG